MSMDVNSVGASSPPNPYSSTASPGAQSIEQPHHHHKGEGGKMAADVASTLSSMGVNIDTSNPDTKSALSSFMHTLMGALHGGGASGKNGGNDHDADDQANGQQAGAAQQTGYGGNQLKQKFDTLISELQSGNSTDPALSSLQDQFSKLTGSANTPGGKNVSLQDFLSSLESKLPQDTPANGNAVNTTA